MIAHGDLLTTCWPSRKPLFVRSGRSMSAAGIWSESIKPTAPRKHTEVSPHSFPADAPGQGTDQSKVSGEYPGKGLVKWMATPAVSSAKPRLGLSTRRTIPWATSRPPGVSRTSRTGVPGGP